MLSLETMDEHKQNWKEIANTMMKINKIAEGMFNIVHVMDQDELEPTWHLLHFSGNIHSVTYNQDLVSPALLARWTELIEFYGLTENHKDVPSTMYSFMKAARFTHLNWEGNTKCRIVYNHHRKTAKIGNGWRNFSQLQNLLPGIQIIFEFPNTTSNFVLFWICL
ncbi:hypothetical protein HKD37_18G050220 [Glycine soja]